MRENSVPPSGKLAIDATEFIRQQREDDLALRELSMEQRGRMIEAACRTAAEIQRSRIASGMPVAAPTPWPASTWALLRKYAPNGRK